MVVDSLEVLHRVAAVVWDLAGKESHLCQTAVAWLITNRLDETMDLMHVTAVCEAIRSEAGAVTRGIRPGQDGFAEMMAFSDTQKRVAAVLARRTQDPTDGARRFHRHNVCPDWSVAVEPSALIGAYFFYPGDSCGQIKPQRNMITEK